MMAPPRREGQGLGADFTALQRSDRPVVDQGAADVSEIRLDRAAHSRLRAGERGRLEYIGDRPHPDIVLGTPAQPIAMGDRSDCHDVHAAGRFAQSVRILHQIGRIVGDGLFDPHSSPRLPVSGSDDNDDNGDIKFANQFIKRLRPRAKRLRQRISSAYAYAISEGIVGADPAAVVGPALKPLPKERLLHRGAWAQAMVAA